MKKWLGLLSVILMCITVLVGCGSQKPEDAVVASLEAVKTVNIEEYNTNTIDDVGLFADSDAWGDGEKQLLDIMFHNLSYTVQNTTVTGEEAIVTVEITSSNLENIISSALSKLIGSAMSGGDMSEEEIAAEMMNSMKEAAYSEDVEISTNTVEIQVVKSDGKWKVKMTDTLLNALGGGSLDNVTSIME